MQCIITAPCFYISYICKASRFGLFYITKRLRFVLSKMRGFTPHAFLYCEAFTPRGSDSQHRKASQSFQNHRQQL